MESDEGHPLRFSKTDTCEAGTRQIATSKSALGQRETAPVPPTEYREIEVRWAGISLVRKRRELVQ